RTAAKTAQEKLLDNRRAVALFDALAEMEGETSSAAEPIRLLAERWSAIAERFEAEAAEALEGNLRASLLARAAGLIAQYGEATEGRDARVDALFREALTIDPAAVHLARLYGEVLYRRGSLAELSEVLLAAAEHALSETDRTALFLHAGRLFARRLDAPRRAAACYERVLDLSPGHGEALGFLVEFLTQEENWDRLVEVYEDAVRTPQSPDDERATLLQLAMVHWRIRDRADEAEPYFSRLRKLDPTHVGVLEFFRERLREAHPDRLVGILQDAERASADGERRLALAEEVADLLTEAVGEGDRVIDAWKSVLRLDPQHERARSTLRRLYAVGGKWNALVELLRTVSEGLSPDARTEKVALLREMASIYGDKLGLEAMRATTYQRILEIEPEDEEATAVLVTAYEGAQRYNDLVQLLERRLDFVKDRAEQVDLRVRIAHLWVDHLGNDAQAVDPLEEVLALDPDHRDALELLKRIYERRRSYSQLYKVLDREAQLASDAAVRLQSKVQQAVLAGDRLKRPGDAIRLWKEVVAQDPEVREGYDELQRLAEAEQDWATLAFALQGAAERTPEPDERQALRWRLATVQAEYVGDPEAAIAALAELLDENPGHLRAQRLLREMLVARKDWDGLFALGTSQDAWEGIADVLGQTAEQAEDVGTRVDLSLRAAQVYEEKLGKPERAFRSYERVLAVDPDHVGAAEALERIYQKEENWGRLARVKERLLGASEGERRTTRLMELAGLAADRLGDTDAAYRWSQQALEHDPDHGPALSALL
ncbi:MAG: tetratricopeptide repeat protein, partial [Myxococcales bacterium]|nr:tetratricopeptide repeat protein [Myxococcales bacterium]